MNPTSKSPKSKKVSGSTWSSQCNSRADLKKSSTNSVRCCCCCAAVLLVHQFKQGWPEFLLTTSSLPASRLGKSATTCRLGRPARPPRGRWAAEPVSIQPRLMTSIRKCSSSSKSLFMYCLFTLFFAVKKIWPEWFDGKFHLEILCLQRSKFPFYFDEYFWATFTLVTMSRPISLSPNCRFLG